MIAKQKSKSNKGKKWEDVPPVEKMSSWVMELAVWMVRMFELKPVMS